MSTPAITVYIDDNISEVASLMRSNEIGSVIVLDNNSHPIGIITERDIVGRVISKNKSPSEIIAGEVMSKPLHRIDPDATITEAAKIMRGQGIRRLVVFKDAELVGIISSDDIAKITPELFTIIMEKSSIEMIPAELETAGLAGQCERCGNWLENLKEMDGQFLCEECLEEA